MAKAYDPFDFSDQQPVRQQRAYDPFDFSNEGSVAGDLGASVLGGGNSLVSIVGGLYGLATGDMDNSVYQWAQENRTSLDAMKSDDLKMRERRLQESIASADGFFDQAAAAVWGTVSDPYLMLNMVAEQLPLLVATGGSGIAARAGATALGVAEKAAIRAGTTGAAVTGGAMNASDIASGTYEQIMSLPDNIWDGNQEFLDRSLEIGAEEAKKEIALERARITAGIVGLGSAATTFLPGSIEKTIVGDVGIAKGGLLKGVGFGIAGEGAQEVIEEGGGQFVSNLAVQDVDPNQDLLEGVGGAAGTAFALGGAIGGAGGGINSQLRTDYDPFAGKEPSEVLADLQARAAALNARIESGIAPYAIEAQRAALLKDADLASRVFTDFTFDLGAILDPISTAARAGQAEARAQGEDNLGQAANAAARVAQTASQPRTVETPTPRTEADTTPPGNSLSDEDLAEIDLRAEVAPVQGRVTEDAERIIRANFGDAAGDRFAKRIKERLDEEIAARQGKQRRVIETPNSRTVIETDSIEAADTAERQLRETEDQRQQQLAEAEAERQQQQAALTPGVDLIGSLRASLNKAIITARREQRALGDSDPQQTQELEDDISRLQLGLKRLQEAQDYEAEGNSAVVSIILNQVRDIAARPILSPESGRRRAFEYVTVLEGELMPRIDETIRLYQQAGAMPQTDRPALKAPSDFEVDPDGSARRPRSTTQQTDIPDIQARDNLIEDQNIIYGEERSPEPVAEAPRPSSNFVADAEGNVGRTDAEVAVGRLNPEAFGEGPALLEQDVEDRPSTQVLRKKNGDSYPTRQSASAALNRVKRENLDYNWNVIEDGAGFALEGRLPEGLPPREVDIQSIRETVRPRVSATDGTVPLEAYEESNLEPVDARFDGLVEAYELGDVDPLVRELDAVAAQRGDLLTRRMNTPISTNDDVLTAITKAGGIDLDEAVAQGLDPADNPGRGRMSLFRRQGGMTFDGVAEFLADNGFTQPAGETYEAGVQGANEALGIVADALNARGDGNLTFLNSGRGAQIESLAQREMEIEQGLEEIRAAVGENLTPQDEVLLDQGYEEMYDEIYGSVDQRTATTEASRQASQAGRDDVASRGRRGEVDARAIPGAEGDNGQAIRQDDGPPQENLVTTQTEPQGSVSRSGTQRTWTPGDTDPYEPYGRVTWDGRPGRENPKPQKKDYSIGRALPVEGRQGVFAREIRSPKGELVGVVEVTEQQSTALYLDTAGSYDVFTPTLDDGMFGRMGRPDEDHQQQAVYTVMDRVLREKRGEPVPPAEFSGKTEAPLLESYTEQDLQDRDDVISGAELNEQRAQVDRERELFDLDSGQGTIAGTNDPTQTDTGQQTLYSRLPDRDGVQQVDNPSRREVLGKIAKAAVAGAAGVQTGSYYLDVLTDPALVRGKAKPMSDFLNNNLPEASLDALRENDLVTAIDAATEGAPAEILELANTIKRLLPDANDYNTGVRQGSWNVSGAVELGQDGVKPKLLVYPESSDTGGVTTLLHEALHLVIIARYRSLSVSGSRNYKTLGMDQPAGREALDQWIDLWREFQETINPNRLGGQKERDLVDAAPFAEQIAYGNPDEFFARALTDPEFQGRLHAIDYQGKTLWERFKDWVKTFLFKPNTGVQPTFLDATLTAAHDIFQSADFDRPDMAFSEAVNESYAASRRRGSDTQNEVMENRISNNEPAPFQQENERIREKNATVVEKIKQKAKRELTPGGLLPKAVFDEKITRDNQMASVEFDTIYYVKQLEKAVKSTMGGSIESLPVDQQARLSDSLAGRLDDSLPGPVKTAVIGMRESIDGLSKQYIEILDRQSSELLAQFSGPQRELLDAYMMAAEANNKREANAILDQAKAEFRESAEAEGLSQDMRQPIQDIQKVMSQLSLLNVIRSNTGVYVNRSYRAFDDSNWFKNVPDSVLNNARQYLSTRMEESGMEPDRIAERVEVVLNDILKEGTAYGSMESFIKESKLGAKDLSILQKKKDIAPEIRALLGEYEDPRVNYAKTTAKMARLIFNTRLLDKVKDVGMGEFLFTEDDRPANTTQIAVEGNKTLEPLNGLYASREVAQAFSDIGQVRDFISLPETIIRINGGVKFGKTVLAPTTQFRNFMSASFFAMANGHWDLRKTQKSLSVVREYFTRDGDAGKLAYLRRLKELGVVYDTPYAGEMMRLLEETKFFDGERAEMGKIRGSVKDLATAAQRMYQFGDDFWKIVGYENEKDNLIGSGMSEADAEVEAADRIRSTYPTYSLVGNFVNALRRFPLAGTFVSFPAEIIRTQYNMIKIAAEDMKTPGRRTMGIKRLVGMSMASAMPYAVQALTKEMFDVSDDEEEAIRLMSPYWSENSNLMFMGRNDKGQLEYLDVSFLDPYNYFKRPINAALRDQPWEESFLSGTQDMIRPFFGTDIFAGALIEAANNKKATGGKIFNESDSLDQQARDKVGHVWKSIEPGIFGNARRIYKAVEEPMTTYGKVYTLEDEAAAFFGFRTTTFDPKTALRFRSYEIKERRNEASSQLRRVLTNPNLAGSEGIEEAIERSLEMRQRTFDEALRLISASRSAGLTDVQIRETLKGTNFGRLDLTYLMEGKVPPMTVSPITVRKQYTSAFRVLGKEKAQQVLERYAIAQDILSEQFE